MTRDLLHEVGGFDERFTRPWREDSDLHFRLLAAGVDIVRAPLAVVVHPVRPLPWGVSLGQQGNAFFEALLYKKHPDAYRRIVIPLVPWLYYSILGCAVGAVSFAALERWTVASVAPAAALAAIPWFAARRVASSSRAPRHVAEMLVTSAGILFLSVYWRLRGALHFRVPFM